METIAVTAMHDTIRTFLKTQPYHACLLLVHPQISRLEQAVDELVVSYDWPRLHVGRELSGALISEPVASRPQQAMSWIDSTLRQMALGPVLCTEIDLMFEPTLDLDPLAALHQVSRASRLIVAWPGSFVNNVLEGLVCNAYTRPHLQTMALRVIHGLSVYRLTTSDIYAPLGATAEQLRDDLCLHTRMPEPSAEFLLDQVQVALREIMRTVSGQYISFNDANGQYYLDVKKDIDFDAKIRERGEFLDEGDLNRYFFDALRQTLGLSDTTYVTGHRIWFYELPWVERKVTRPGYLFFGAPDERSTAQPPRDFYVYILPPFIRREWQDEQRSDEVILQLTGLDQTFQEIVRLYAGARALANEAPSYRDTYEAKAEGHLGRLRNWLRDNLTGQLQISYQGVSRPVSAALGETRSSASQTFVDLLRVVASHLLAPEFGERYPEYPTFRLAQPVSEGARPNDALEAARFLAGRGRTNLAVGVLEGLELLDGQGSVRPYQSRYAKCFLDLLQAKPEGQVVNRGELIEQVAGGIQPVEKDVFFHLEPEWVAVALLALVYNGDIVLNLDGREPLDASNIERAATVAIGDLTNFRFYARPRTLPINLWATIFEGLELSPGLIRDENTRPQAVIELQRVVRAELERTAAIQGRLQQGLQLWNTSVFTDRFTIQVQAGVVVGSDAPAVSLHSTDLVSHLRGYKAFLETLARFDTVGRLRNLRLSLGEITDAVGDRRIVDRAETLVGLVTQLQPLCGYLAEAQANLPASHAWSERAASGRESLLNDVRRLGKGENAGDVQAILRELETLKAQYVTTYSDLHRQMVLGPQADDRRQRLYNDPRLAALNALSSIELLNAAELRAWKETLAELPTCREFHGGVIADAPTCSYCHLRPAQRGQAAQGERILDQLDRKLDEMLTHWRQALRANLQSETAQHSLAAMTPEERRPIEAFLDQADNDTAIPEGFVNAAIQALRGLQAVAVRVDALIDALRAGGLPCTVVELQQRLAAFVREMMRGHDVRNTRLTLDDL